MEGLLGDGEEEEGGREKEEKGRREEKGGEGLRCVKGNVLWFVAGCMCECECVSRVCMCVSHVGVCLVCKRVSHMCECGCESRVRESQVCVRITCTHVS